MAAEVARQAFHFVLPGLSGDAVTGYIFQATSPRLFWYNPLHDLESLWWIGIWLLLRNCARGEKPPAKLDEQLLLSQQLFPIRPRLANLYRHDNFWTKAMLTASWAILCPDFVLMWLGLVVMRNTLVEPYEKAERSHDIDESAFQDAIHNIFISNLVEHREPAKEKKLKLRWIEELKKERDAEWKRNDLQNKIETEEDALAVDVFTISIAQS